MAMMDSITGSPPTPPNPIATGAAQTGTNVATGVANAFLGNVNQVTPNGSLTYAPTGNYSWQDPTSGVSYNIPTFTATQTLTDAQNEVNWRNQASQFNLANLGKDQSYQLWQALQDPNSAFNNPLNGAPRAADPNMLNVGDASTSFNDVGGVQRSLGDYGQQQQYIDQTGMPISNQFGDVGGQQYGFGGTQGQQQYGFADVGNQGYTFGNTQYGPQYGFAGTPDATYGFGDAGNITRSYGPGDFSADRSHVEDALMQRMAPQLQQDRQRLEQQLADQGIRYGSPAYDDAMRQLNQQQTDARFAAISQAGSEQQRMMDMAAQRAGFENAAQQQAYQQAQGRGQFYNTAAAQNFAQAQARGQFMNAAQQQEFAQQQARGQFTNDAQQRAYEQAQGRAAFANTAQAQDFAQQQARGTFANQAQQTAFAQAQARGQFANAAELQAFQEAQARGQFTNEAQAQRFAQMLGAGNFANTAQQQDFTQQAARAQFYNSGVAQQQAMRNAQYGAQNATRGQYLQEQYGQRNQMINTLTSLMSGSQISQPDYVNTKASNIPTTDYAGLINNNFNQQLGIYQQQSQNTNQLLGGIFGMIGNINRGTGTISDERVKENVEKIGTVFAAGNDNDPRELPIYEYSYKADPSSTRHVGPMAQDVEKIDPRAVGTTRGGVKYIDNTRMGSILRPVGMRKAA